MLRFSLKLLSETFFILERNERDMIKNVFWFPCKVPVQFSSTSRRNFLERFSKNTQIIKFHENPHSGSQVVPCRQTDRRTERHFEADVVFGNFANAPENRLYVPESYNITTVMQSKLNTEHAKKETLSAVCNPL